MLTSVLSLCNGRHARSSARQSARGARAAADMERSSRAADKRAECHHHASCDVRGTWSMTVLEAVCSEGWRLGGARCTSSFVGEAPRAKLLMRPAGTAACPSSAGRKGARSAGTGRRPLLDDGGELFFDAQRSWPPPRRARERQRRRKATAGCAGQVGVRDVVAHDEEATVLAQQVAVPCFPFAGCTPSPPRGYQRPAIRRAPAAATVLTGVRGQIVAGR